LRTCVPSGSRSSVTYLTEACRSGLVQISDTHDSMHPRERVCVFATETAAPGDWHRACSQSRSATSKGVPCANSHLYGDDSRYSSCRSGCDGGARRWPRIRGSCPRLADGYRFCVGPAAQFLDIHRFDSGFRRYFAYHVSDRRCVRPAEPRDVYRQRPLALHVVALLRKFRRVPRPPNDYGARDPRLGLTEASGVDSAR